MVWAPPTMADTDTSEMPQNVYSLVMVYNVYQLWCCYHKEKDWFGMPQNYYCPVGLVLPLHYFAIIEKVAAILYKRRWFSP